MPKKTRTTADSQSGQHKSHSTSWSRLGALVPFQRRRQQDGEGLLHTHEPFVANPTTSVGHEGPSSVFEEVRCYLRIRELDLKSFHAVNHIQSIPTGVEDADMDSIPGPANIEIGLVDTAMTQLDTTNTGYRQTLSTFSSAVNGITRVCHPGCGRSSLTDDRA